MFSKTIHTSSEKMLWNITNNNNNSQAIDLVVQMTQIKTLHRTQHLHNGPGILLLTISPTDETKHMQTDTADIASSFDSAHWWALLFHLLFTSFYLAHVVANLDSYKFLENMYKWEKEKKHRPELIYPGSEKQHDDRKFREKKKCGWNENCLAKKRCVKNLTWRLKRKREVI